MSQKNTMHTMIAAAALVLALASTSATRAEVLWSSIGAAGSPDEGSMKSFDARRASLFIASDAQLPATVVARYTISPSDRLSLQDAALVADMLDNGAGGKVSVHLYEVNLTSGSTGSPQVKLTIDSDGMTPAATFQRGTDCRPIVFDFEHNAYFIQVTLSRSHSALQPALRSLQIVSADSCE